MEGTQAKSVILASVQQRILYNALQCGFELPAKLGSQARPRSFIAVRCLEKFALCERMNPRGYHG